MFPSRWLEYDRKRRQVLTLAGAERRFEKAAI